MVPRGTCSARLRGTGIRQPTTRARAGVGGNAADLTVGEIMTVPSGNGPGRIFMSYRREDTDYPAAWLYERLVHHFSGNEVFKDIDSIELGADFVDVITTAVESCEVLLALIGNRWLTADRDGRRRLDDPNDFVRVEIEAALTRNVRVIPVLVEGARMPRADELPASLAMLARRQALELSPSRFDLDTQRLLRLLERTITRSEDGAPAGALSVRERPKSQVGSSGSPDADVPSDRQGAGVSVGRRAGSSLKVFINYRREDTQGTAWALYMKLDERLGTENVFFDYGTLQPGMQWFDQIKSHLGQVGAVVVLIGRNWMPSLTSHLQRGDEDTVVKEIDLALQIGPRVTLIPVLVDDAELPDPRDLPLSLRALLSFQAERLRAKYLPFDIDHLIERLAEVRSED